MGLFKTMKTNAKRMMGGAWGRAILIMLIAVTPVILINLLEGGIRMVSGIPEFMDYAGTAGFSLDDMANNSMLSLLISLLMWIFAFIVSAPLQQGIVRWYYNRTNGGNEGVFDLFYYFETVRGYFKSIGVAIAVGLRMIFWGILLCLPSVGILVAYSLANQTIGMTGGVRTICRLLLLVWIVLAAIIFELISLRYFLARYLLAAHPEMKVRHAVKNSTKLTRGQKGSLFLFELSFILWFVPMILAILALIPAIFAGSALALYSVQGVLVLAILVQCGLAFYLNPYMNSAYAVYARYLIQVGEEGADGSSATREYTAYKPDIDRYVDAQQPPKPAPESVPDSAEPVREAPTQSEAPQERQEQGTTE